MKADWERGKKREKRSKSSVMVGDEKSQKNKWEMVQKCYY